MHGPWLLDWPSKGNSDNAEFADCAKITASLVSKRKKAPSGAEKYASLAAEVEFEPPSPHEQAHELL